MGISGRQRRSSSATATTAAVAATATSTTAAVAAVFFLCYIPPPVYSFFVPRAAVIANTTPPRNTYFSSSYSSSLLTSSSFTATDLWEQKKLLTGGGGRHGNNGFARFSKRRSRTRGAATMERPSGQFQRLAKPKFDRNNPNAVLGELKVPGLEQVCMSAQTQLFPKREAVQLLKERLQAWCEEENRREREGEDEEARAAAPRTWRAYEFVGLPSRNRTLDSEVLGMNVGLPVNDTRLEVAVDFGKETEARDVGARLLDMVADVSREANEVFGYADDAAAGGDNLGPWKKSGNVNSWRKWLELDSGEPLPASAVTVFRTVQANWAVPEKIAAAMNFTASWCTARFKDSMASPARPLRRVEVLHSAVHPHVLKVMETFDSADAMLDHFHRHYEEFLEGVYDFRAAVNPTLQAYTPLCASLRPCLSARLVGGATIPLVAIGGEEDGVAPSASVILEGVKLGLRHVVLEASSSGVEEAVEALVAALAFKALKRSDLFVTMIVGEENARSRGGGG